MEIWKDVKGYEGLYQISDLGRIKSSFMNGKIMSQAKDKKGYLRICLRKNGNGKNLKIHRLVAEAFIPNPLNFLQVNHKDENKQNNCVDNLEWCDCTYNNCYNDRMKKIAYKNGKKVRCIETNKVYYSINEASRATGITYSNIVYVCQGKYNQAKGYHFKYED